jgi:hypothetical protein
VWTSTRRRTDRLPRLVLAPDLAAAGVDPDVARRAVASGTWREVLPGAWLRDSRDVSRIDRQRAALARAGPAALLSGADACRAYGMRDVPEDPLVTVLARSSCQTCLGPDVRLLRTTRLPEAHVVAGLRCAEPLRAVADAARAQGDLQDVRALVLAAVADLWCDVPGLVDELAAGPRRGSALLRRAVADAAGGAASAPEAEMADVAVGLAARRRLPRPVLNHVLWLGTQRIGQPDGYLPGTGVGWEADSRRHHGSQQALDATLERHEDYARAGLDVLHRSPQRVRRDPAAFAAVLLERVLARRELDPPEPAGLLVLPPDVVPAALSRRTR